MIWTRRHTLAAGLALIAATNVVVLAGVAWNRSGEPEAQLRLTERELNQPYSWGFAKENSGLALQLKWNLPARYPAAGDADEGPRWGEASWFDRAKLAELGFDLSRAERLDDERYAEPLPREALLVLEMDGPAYQAALQRAERRIAALEKKLAANPADNSLRNSVGWATRTLEDIRHRASRLYIVDAGLDRDKLRAKYPDRARYAIMSGRVRLSHPYGPSIHPSPVVGYVEQVNVDEINVPAGLRGTMGGERSFEASVAFGRRLEPWFTSASPRPKPPG